MNVTFRLRFRTQAGQSLWLAGIHSELLELEYFDSESWQAVVSLPPEIAKSRLNYFYVLRNEDGSTITDWGVDRQLVPANFDTGELLVLDSWNDAGLFANAFYTAPFKNVLLKDNVTTIPALPLRSATHTFRVKAPLLVKGQTICLMGEGAALRDWRTSSPILLSRCAGEDHFAISLDLRGAAFPLAYKYGVFDFAENRFVQFEQGENRSIDAEAKRDRHTLIDDGFIHLPADTWRGVGVAVPVFSLRSEKSFGVGEFADLKPLANWGRSVGLKMIQLLPVNDTNATGTWKDSYPYAAISAFALHPLYLNLAAVVDFGNEPLLQALESERKRLNALEAVDYEAVMKIKLGFLQLIFPSQKAATFRNREYKAFFAENQHWLEPYAAFCYLRDKFGTVDFSQWPHHQRYDAQEIKTLARDNDDVAFHYFVQYHLHRQLLDATAHAHAAGLVVKGDIAIGVYRHGADVWQEPELYHLDLQAGAPPDAFSSTGQNWGFPTYNWPRMAEDGFSWWKQRFTQLGTYFDAFRIDHILGFFRIWSSPAHAVEGILGHFAPAIPVEPAEFLARGIPFVRDRLTKPFIDDDLLRELFGAQANHVRRKFLIAISDSYYTLKPEFATQRQIEKEFSRLEENPANTKLKIGLYQLISNVILLEADGKYHFRFEMNKTSSFQNLPTAMQQPLQELYIDYFFRRQDGFWKREALQKLPALKRVTNMLICGEDLGLVPACVPEVMRDLGFLSLEIQRMPKMMGIDFSRPADAPYLSVVTPSTHDMSTIRGWWEEDRDSTQKFFSSELEFAGEAPTIAGSEMVEAVVRQHLASPAMWSVFQLQDLLGMSSRWRRKSVDDERINVPAIPQFYWRYRLHLTLEELQCAKDFNTQLSQLIRENGR